MDALVHVPYGSYPHECYGLYDAEPPHFSEYVAGIQQHGADGVARYLDRYVYGPATHEEYLALFGERAAERHRGRRRTLPRAARDRAVTARTELLAVMGARELRDSQTVFTGVGRPCWPRRWRSGSTRPT